uniref:Sodium/hydrogen exchanger n=1 Tax=Spongospora subterranea TaxID=70186 RepID=A0A0H5R824_9EUKA|eukprot:CRZ04448.1 hypothetical protein [Spongospora subterranea]
MLSSLLDATDTAGGHANSHDFVGLNSLLFVLVVGVCLFLARVIREYKLYYIPSSAASMIFGVLIGIVIIFLGSEEAEFVRFQPNLFFYVLLPPIIFHAGYSLRRREFFRNLTTIMMFAVFGTLISTLVIGYFLYGLALLGLIGLDSSNPLECLTFAALISAVDPVATLSILGSRDINADPLLYNLVFGETVLNDAVSIVLFKTFQQSVPTQPAFSIVNIMAIFSGVSIASTLVGTGVALLCAYVFRCVEFKESPAHEYTLMFLFAYSSYCLSEIAGLSGVMALFICGIVMHNYTWYSLSSTTRRSTKHIFHSFALLAETFLFAYVGITAGMSFKPEIGLKWSPMLVIFTLFACFLARAVHIFPGSALVNLRRKRKITFPMQVVMWFAGLRGAVSFALALSVDTPNRSIVITTTLTIVFFTTVVCGGLTEPLLSKLKLRRDCNDVRNPLMVIEENGHREIAVPQDAEEDDDVPQSPSSPIGGIHKMWVDFDEYYMKAWFGGPNQDQKGHIVFSSSHPPPSLSLRSVSTSATDI